MSQLMSNSDLMKSRANSSVASETYTNPNHSQFGATSHHLRSIDAKN